LILLSVLSVIHLKVRHHQANESQCRTCQKVVYELKFDKLADCGDKACRSTCHKIVRAWNAPNSSWADFQNDLLGKCDVCFRNGFCSLTECDSFKANELSVVNHAVENGLFRGKVDQESGTVYSVKDNSKGGLSPSAVKEMEKNVKKSLRHSIAAQNAQQAAKEIGSVVTTAAVSTHPSSSSQAHKVLKRDVVYNDFILQANTISEATDQEINELNALLTDYAKMKDFKTVSPVESKVNNQKERFELRKKAMAILDEVKNSIYKNYKLVVMTLNHVEKSIKKANDFKQRVLKNGKELTAAQKNELATLETEVRTLESFRTTLIQLREKFHSKKVTLKSFSFRIN